MTTLENIVRLRKQREEIVKQHVEAENRHDIDATIATFDQPRYEMNGAPSDGEAAVRELLAGLIQGFPDIQAEDVSLRHMEGGVLVEGMIRGTHSGDWAGIPPTGRRVDVPVVEIFEFDDDRLVCEKVFTDMATVLTQIGVLPGNN